MTRTYSGGRETEQPYFPLEAQCHISFPAQPWWINENVVHLSGADGYSHGRSQILPSYGTGNSLNSTQLSLFIGDLLQAIGSVMDLKWVGSGHLEVGQFCSAQGGFLFPSPPG